MLGHSQTKGRATGNPNLSLPHRATSRLYHPKRPAWRALWQKGSRPFRPEPTDPIIRYVSEREQKVWFSDWHWAPVVEGVDDLLLNAVTEVLSTDTAAFIGKCQECGRYYVSLRRHHHRYCPDKDCRDLHHRKESGSQRAMKSRAARRLKASQTQTDRGTAP